jgi:hypothetical protein
MTNLWRFALLFALLLVVPLSAQDQAAQVKESPRESGNAFVRLCSAVENKQLSEEDFGNVMDCIGYVSGFTEGVYYEAMYATAKGKQVAPEAFCIPDDVEHGQLIRVILKHIRDNPENAHKRTSVLIIKALGKAYPCPSK